MNWGMPIAMAGGIVVMVSALAAGAIPNSAGDLPKVLTAVTCLIGIGMFLAGVGMFFWVRP